MNPEPAPARGRLLHRLRHGRHLGAPAVVAGVLAATVAAGSIAVWAGNRGPAPRVEAAGPGVPVPVPVLHAGSPTGPATAVPWQGPLTLTVTDGTLQDVTVLDPDGKPFPGAAEDDRSWRSTATSLLPAATYRVTAVAVDDAGETRPLTLAARTTAATRVLHAVLSPGDGAVVGVGQPVVVTLDHPVKGKADRAAVVRRLAVTTVPAVQGAWRWMENNELHYRPATYWATGTRITVRSDLHRLSLSDGTWGSGQRSTSYTIGASMISTVDVTAHTMTVRRNGKVLRVAKVSTGRDKYPTKGGVHLVLEKTRLKIMDSATVGIPRNSPDGYYEKVPFSIRISYGGAFVHSADWSVRDQGVRNVSHGCVNMSPADAEWFFGISKRGDVVDVIHASAKPVLYDPGMSDWNIPFSQWAN